MALQATDQVSDPVRQFISALLVIAEIIHHWQIESIDERPQQLPLGRRHAATVSGP